MTQETAESEAASGPNAMATSASYIAWLSGTLITTVGDAAFGVALGWQATGFGPVVAGVILAITSWVSTFFLLVGGAVSDALNPRRVMLLSTAGMCAVFVCAAILAEHGKLGALGLILLAIILGLEVAFYTPASASMTRQLVTRAQFGRALSMRQMTGQLANIVGRPIGGLLVAVSGFALASLANAASFAAMLIVLALVRAPESSGQRRKTGVLRSIGEGVGFIARDRVLKSVVALTAVVAGFLLPMSTLLVPLIARSRHMGSLGSGWMLATITVMTLAIALLVSVRGPAKQLGLWALIGAGVASAGFGVLCAPSALAAYIGCAITGLGQGIYITHGAPLVRNTPEHLMGRVQSAQALVQTGALGVCTLGLGLLVAHTSIETALALCGTALAVAAILASFNRKLRSARI